MEDSKSKQETKNKKEPISRWQNISIGDSMCLFYWILALFTLFVFSGIRQDFNRYFHLESIENKIIFLFACWFLTITVFQSSLGQKGYLKGLWAWIIFPFSMVRITTGFLLDSRKTFTKLYNNMPLKRMLVLSLPITYLIAFSKSDPTVLSITRYAIFVQLSLLIAWSFRWCINPLKSLQGLKSLKEKATKAKIISGLAKLDKKNDENKNLKNLIIQKIETLTKAFNALEYISKKVGSTSFLFSWFLGMWAFVIFNVVIGSAGILRILDVTSPSGVFSGALFKGEPVDYIFISAFQFLGSDVHGATITSRDVLFVLGLLPLASLFLFVVVITAYTMVAQSKFEDAVLETHKEVGTLFTEAVKEVKTLASKEMSPEQLIDLDKNNIVEVNSLKEINLQEKVGNELPTQ
ncbi:MAG: hypothetical protein KDD50_07245 [Bdellovibrionales bacterium]|nr:hypothetical protein [Bdellovibrionales bacterium]